MFHSNHSDSYLWCVKSRFLLIITVNKHKSRIGGFWVSFSDGNIEDKNNQDKNTTLDSDSDNSNEFMCSAGFPNHELKRMNVEHKRCMQQYHFVCQESQKTNTNREG